MFVINRLFDTGFNPGVGRVHRGMIPETLHQSIAFIQETMLHIGGDPYRAAGLRRMLSIPVMASPRHYYTFLACENPRPNHLYVTIGNQRYFIW